MSGARPGRTPSSPSYIGNATNSAAASSTARSGVTTTHCNCLPLVDSTGRLREESHTGRDRWAVVLLPALHALRRLDRFFDRADVHERLLGQVVVLTVADFLERADRLGQG